MLRNTCISILASSTIIFATASHAGIVGNYVLTPMNAAACSENVVDAAMRFSTRTGIPVIGDCYVSESTNYLRFRTQDNSDFPSARVLRSGKSTTYTVKEVVRLTLIRGAHFMFDTGDVEEIHYETEAAEKVPVRKTFGNSMTLCQATVTSVLGGGDEIILQRGVQSPFAGYCYDRGDGMIEAQLFLADR